MTSPSWPERARGTASPFAGGQPVHARVIDVLPWLRSIRPLLTLVDPLAVVLAGLAVHEHVSVLSVAGAALAATLVGRSADLHRSRLVLSVLEDLPKLVLVTL